MTSMENLLGMIVTKALEYERVSEEDGNPRPPSIEPKPANTLPPIRYDPELIANPDGTYT